MIRCLLILAALAPAAVTAQVRFQDTTAIDVAVAAFTGRAIGEEGGARTIVDARLKLAACPLPQLDWRGTNQDAVVVRCDGPAWRIFVPVKLAPQAMRPTLVAAAAAAPAVKAVPVIKRGDPVTIEAGSTGFSITRDGIAMGDAAPGGRFMVKVDPAKPPIQAVAIESGRATLPGWGQ
jgi:flagella basal body P-ring formation protein FlgA